MNKLRKKNILKVFRNYYCNRSAIRKVLKWRIQATQAKMSYRFFEDFFEKNILLKNGKDKKTGDNWYSLQTHPVTFRGVL